jgi:hypothetical protein
MQQITRGKSSKTEKPAEPKSDAKNDADSLIERLPRKLEQCRFDLIFKLVQALAHSEMTLGNASLTMMKWIQRPDGSFVRVPIVTADTIRHQLRGTLAMATLFASGLMEGDGPEFTIGGLRLTFQGGMLVPRGDTKTNKGSDKGVNLTGIRALSDLVLSIGLFGGCANSHMIPGRSQIDDAYLLCEETRHLWPYWVSKWVASNSMQVHSFRQHVKPEMRVRGDILRDPTKVMLLSEIARLEHEDQMISRENAHETADAAAKEDAKSTMLPRTCESIVAGSHFFWNASANVYDALQRDAFDVSIHDFFQVGEYTTDDQIYTVPGILGGKSGTAHGRVTPVQGWTAVKGQKPQEVVMGNSEIGVRLRKHARDNADKLRKVLATVRA